jgi:putative membrane protein insertion efficiency factor
VKKFAQLLIEIYQKYLTILGYGSCRYYPTCSQYSKEQFRFNSFFKALFFSTKRVATCNHLFIGGIDYPIISKEFQNLIPFKSAKKIEYWFVPTGEKNRFFVVKSNVISE